MRDSGERLHRMDDHGNLRSSPDVQHHRGGGDRAVHLYVDYLYRDRRALRERRDARDMCDR
jgi:hypothetical protein